jgi:hypothetical protein
VFNPSFLFSSYADYLQNQESVGYSICKSTYEREIPYFYFGECRQRPDEKKWRYGWLAVFLRFFFAEFGGLVFHNSLVSGIKVCSPLTQSVKMVWYQAVAVAGRRRKYTQVDEQNPENECGTNEQRDFGFSNIKYHNPVLILFFQFFGQSPAPEIRRYADTSGELKSHGRLYFFQIWS